MSNPEPYPGSHWLVPVECREPGAIGVFTWTKFYVRAELSHAQEWALEDAHMDGWETRAAGAPQPCEPKPHTLSPE